jgi:hypothetical protein
MLQPTEEVLTAALDPEGWYDEKIPGVRKKVLWNPVPGGPYIAIFRVAKGSGIPSRHKHACNQFLYCLEGRYAYPTSGLVLEPGSFYWNPKDNEHGPTEALEDSLLLEYYDGAHYYERPEYHHEDYAYAPESSS